MPAIHILNIPASAPFSLKRISISLGIVCLLFSACLAPEPDRPNILFLFADDQRADTIGAWGKAGVSTPNIDQLAREGFSFLSNYNMGGNSGAVCIPSRAMVNSGKAYFRVQHDLNDTVLLPELLGAHGYTTFATGKWHNGPSSWLRAFQRGKAVFFGGMSDHTRVPLQDLAPDGTLINDREEGFSSEVFADAVIEFLRTYSEDGPFYAYVAFTAPHDPRQPPMPYREMYYENLPPLPLNFLPHHPFEIGDMQVRDEQLASWPRPPALIREQIAEYYGLISHLDTQVGRILKALEEAGHGENTYVIYAADHGLAVGSHGLLGKQSVYEHSQRSPLIITGPKIPHGSSVALTYLFDLFPTISALANIPSPIDLDGLNLSRLWTGEQEKIRDSLFLAYTDVARSVRDNRYKLIRYPQINRAQLFDLEDDPDEMQNLVNDSSHSKRVEELTTLLVEWQQRVGDTQSLVTESIDTGTLNIDKLERSPDRWQPPWIIQKYF
ncbi:MAG: sulfatase-like hydrolase/transferase [Acidobacteriota bacterium]|nr:sulfatase-like hydrolase/transferase [Acidobacteriota bacterium]